ncbi:MAG: CNNM domain-containing protein [Planctomycetaceae bacterium]
MGHDGLQFLSACLLFIVALRMTAFFSGTETGLYRLNPLRVSVDALAGDQIARRLLWYVQHPSHFVATTLVGNNVANFVESLAINMAVSVFLTSSSSDWAVEIAATMFFTPIIFLFGDLIPKSLFFRAPMMLLRKNLRWFDIFYRLFLAISLPLVWISSWAQRFAVAENRPESPFLGRQRLLELMGRGHQEGLLTEIQNRLVNGLLHTAVQPVLHSMIPSSRVLGLSRQASQDEILRFADQYAAPLVILKEEDAGEKWSMYIRPIDLTIAPGSATKWMKSMPRIELHATKLEALLTMRQEEAPVAVVVDGERILGVVFERGLVEQLFRPMQQPV